MNQLVPLTAFHVPLLVTSAGDRAQTRFWKFFVVNTRNPNMWRGPIGKRTHRDEMSLDEVERLII